jgi:hypothetical protein
MWRARWSVQRSGRGLGVRGWCLAQLWRKDHRAPQGTSTQWPTPLHAFQLSRFQINQETMSPGSISSRRRAYRPGNILIAKLHGNANDSVGGFEPESPTYRLSARSHFTSRMYRRTPVQVPIAYKAAADKVIFWIEAQVMTSDWSSSRQPPFLTGTECISECRNAVPFPSHSLSPLGMR